MSEDNKQIVPFGATIVCRRCKVTLKHGDVVYNDGAGYLYCSKHNPKKKVGASEYKRAQLNPIPRITAQDVRDRIEETKGPGGRGKRDERQ